MLKIQLIKLKEMWIIVFQNLFYIKLIFKAKILDKFKIKEVINLEYILKEKIIY